MSAQQDVAEPRLRSKLAQGQPVAAGRLRLAYLDGLRAIASAYVVCFHAVPGFWGDRLSGSWRVLRRAFAYGHEAVAVFIVLSGYCLMLPVLRRDPERLGLQLGRFLRRRAFRILPPYFAALGLSLALLALLPVLRQPHSGTIWDDTLPGLDARAIISHLLLVHNWLPGYAFQINGPLWSVATEWQIYFFFPLLLLPAWRRGGLVAAALVAAAVGYAPLLFARKAAYDAVPWYLLLFYFGMLAAALGFSSGPRMSRLRERVPWGLVSAGLALVCAAWSNLAASVWFSLKPVTDPLIGLVTATLLVHLTQCILRQRRSALLPLLESRALVGLGHFSYSLYLTHLPVLALLYFWLQARGLPCFAQCWLLLGGGMVASLAAAFVFYVLVERRFLLER